MALHEMTLQTVQYFGSLRDPVVSETLAPSNKSKLSATRQRLLKIQFTTKAMHGKEA